MWDPFRKEHQWQIKEFFFTLRLLRQNPSAVAGFIIIALMVLMALSASFLSPYDPIRISLERSAPAAFLPIFSGRTSLAEIS